MAEGGACADAVLWEAKSKPEHLKWLNSKDQRVLARGECLSALREEQKVLRDMSATMSAYRSATEHCRVASEADPQWFTLDVQDCQSRRISILRDALAVLQADPAPIPADAEMTDGVRGKIYQGYAHTAQVTSSLVANIHDSDQAQLAAQTFQTQGQVVATSARTAIGKISSHFRRGENGPSNEPSPPPPRAPVANSSPPRTRPGGKPYVPGFVPGSI